jgi:DNA-binding NarL/FixJ family response regulator
LAAISSQAVGAPRRAPSGPILRPESVVATRVLIAAHRPEVVSRVDAVLRRSSDFLVCGCESTAVSAVARAVQERPDLCLFSLDLPGGGVGAAWEVAARLPRVKIVMLTTSPDIQGLAMGLAAGIAGYVRADTSLRRLPFVLLRVMEGEVVVPRASIAQLAAELRGGRARRRAVAIGYLPARLTSREWEVLDLLCDGRGTSEIGRRLEISHATVRSHIAGALRKLGLPDRESAVRLLGQS